MPDTAFSPFAETIFRQKYSLNGKETWTETARRVPTHVLAATGYGATSDEVTEITRLISERKFIPGGRYLYAAGREFKQVNNCFLYRAEDTREGWGDLARKATLALMSGGGIGVDYSSIRERGAVVKRTGGFATGPCALMNVINEGGRQYMQGGSRRSAIWAGLRWDHPDIDEFMRLKDWSEELRAMKAKDFNFWLPMELTNISVQLNDEFFEAYDNPAHVKHEHARRVYWKTIEKMTVTGEPGFSVDTGNAAGETLRNACTEVTSADDSDVCNLGSVNLARIESLTELREVLQLATLFLVSGTVYSDIPHDEVSETREKNRRLGLGLMGVHEWLIKRGKSYGPDEELGSWLGEYSLATGYAGKHADDLSLSRPVKTRALAPNGTIGIIGETTTSMEPVFAKAFKRRYLNGSDWKFQYVVDPTVERVVTEHGIDADTIEDAYSLAHNVERRISMQHFIQKHVDHGISSTINLPYPLHDKSEQRAFGESLLKYLPGLRGVTCYPDGARGGQPLETVDYHYAKRQEGVVSEEDAAKCIGGVCGV